MKSSDIETPTSSFEPVSAADCILEEGNGNLLSARLAALVAKKPELSRRVSVETHKNGKFRITSNTLMVTAGTLLVEEDCPAQPEQFVEFLGNRVQRVQVSHAQAEGGIGYDFSVRTEIVRLPSTNGILTVGTAPISHKVLSMVILFSQITMMSFVCVSHQEEDSDLSATLFFLRMFIGAFLGFKLADNFTQEFYSDLQRVICFSNPDNVNEIVKVCLMPIFVLGIAIVKTFVAVFLLFASVPLMTVPWAEILWLFDIVLVVLSIVATAVVVRVSDRVIISVIYFLGVLMILEFDKVVAHTIQYKIKEARIVQKVKTDEEETEGEVTESVLSLRFLVAMSLGIFSWLSLVGM